MATSSIEWTNKTWNPVSGCTRVSEGCDNCYAVTMTKRLEAMGQDKYSGLVNIGKNHFNGQVKCHEDALLIPLKWKKPCRVFVNSMSDLFHKEVPFEFIDKVFAVMALTPHITYQILTKRPDRMAEYFESYWSPKDFAELRGVDLCRWLQKHDLYETAKPVFEAMGKCLPNVWLGTSVENQDVADGRIPHLLRCPAAVRFLSCEPLLGEVKLNFGYWWIEGCGKHGKTPFMELQGRCLDKFQVDCSECEKRKSIDSRLHWVIVGGESGPNARPMHPDWARSLRDQCQSAGVPFFFKQWGEWAPGDYTTYEKVGKHRAGRLLDGREWNEFPKELK